MAWQAPPGFTSMNLPGNPVPIEANEDGFIDMTACPPEWGDRLTAAMLAAGFVPVDDEIMHKAAQKRVADAANADQIAADKAKADEANESAQAEHKAKLTEALAAADESAPPAEEAGFDPTTVTAENIDAMNRNELFAFLKSRGISAQPPIKNDELRALAHDAIKG